MTSKKWIVSLTVLLGLLGTLFLWPGTSVQATPLRQMTPGVDPMSVPTIAAPTPQPGNVLTDPDAVSGTTMACPMMSGSMTGMTGMAGMTMGTGMQSMSAMGQMGNMSTVGTMPMVGVQGINDELYNAGQRGWYYSLNPWRLIGWVLLVVLMLLVVAALVIGVLWLVRQFRGSPPAASG